jgi:hypothetical protein
VPRGDKKRPSTDIHRRLQLLPYAKKVIETSSTIQNITRKNGDEYFILEAMMAVGLDKKIEY